MYSDTNSLRCRIVGNWLLKFAQAFCIHLVHEENYVSRIYRYVKLLGELGMPEDSEDIKRSVCVAFNRHLNGIATSSGSSVAEIKTVSPFPLHTYILISWIKI